MRTRTTLAIALAGATLLLAAGPVSAHHAMVAEFNLARPITLKGTLTRMEWVNPHGWLYVDVKGPEGPERWKIETGSPFRMEKQGLRKTDFRIGGDVIVNGFAAKDGSLTAAGLSITFSNHDKSVPRRETSFVLGR